jgi:hypothetical protein
MKPMSCGGCGGRQFSIEQEISCDRLKPFSLHVKCDKCKSVTVVGVSQPSLTLSWGEKSDGILCVMPGDE